jgi:hypothetical protein
MQIKMIKLAEIVPYENNPRMNDGAVAPVAESIKRYGFKVPMILDANNVIVTGHTRYKAAQALGMTEVPAIYADDLTPEQIKEFRLVDNKTAEFAQWDFSKLEEELDGLDFGDFDFGFTAADDIDAIDGEAVDRTGNLAKKLLIPPFSVLYGNKGEWLNRKASWLKMGIKSEVGRGGGACVSTPRMDGETITADAGCINGHDVQNR